MGVDAPRTARGELNISGEVPKNPEKFKLKDWSRDAEKKMKSVSEEGRQLREYLRLTEVLNFVPWHPDYSRPGFQCDRFSDGDTESGSQGWQHYQIRFWDSPESEPHAKTIEEFEERIRKLKTEEPKYLTQEWQSRIKRLERRLDFLRTMSPDERKLVLQTARETKTHTYTSSDGSTHAWTREVYKFLPPTSLVFEVGEGVILPLYARHFRSCWSKVSLLNIFDL
jgi:hypothetical protein